jgi:acyl-CoA thioesterase
MTINWTISAGEMLAFLGALLSPLIAVQVTKWLDRRKIRHEEQMKLFLQLMANRGADLSAQFVGSLNSIDVIFGDKAQKEKDIRAKWKELLNHLSSPQTPTNREQWIATRVERQTELLHQIALYLGFDYDKTHIQTVAYSPQLWGDVETQVATIRKTIAAHMNANGKGIPVEIVTTDAPK